MSADIPIISGNLDLLRSNPVLILNSRQSKTPVGADPWVRQTIAACQNMIAQNKPLIASIGMNTWELNLWAVGEFGGQAIVILPLDRDHRTVREDYNLDSDRIAWISVPSQGSSRSRKSWWEARDSIAFDTARSILPVSVRSGGRWDNLLRNPGTHQLIDERFRVQYDKKHVAETEIEVPESCFSCADWPYVTHWTCRSYKPWPGEKSADFYRDVASSDTAYPRNAARTLDRILRENLLRGSGNHIRQSRPVVAFTSLQPADALQLMRWRCRYVRPTFEPYGIAIHLRAARRCGIQPVTYIKSDEPAIGDQVRLQGYGRGNWPAEAEWRAIGDLDLSTIPDDDVLVLTSTALSAALLRGITSFRVQPLTEPFSPD